MKTINISIFFLVATTFILQGQSIKRAYRNLEKLDFEKSNELFSEIIVEEPQNVAAHFGLAVIYSHDNYPGKDYLVAWKHARFTEENINKLDQDNEEILKEYFISTEERRSSRPVEKKIALANEQMLDKLIRLVRESNDLEIVYQVIEEFPDFRYAENVIHIRNYLEFRAVEKENTIDAYNRFITRFPDAAQVPQALDQRNKLAFNKAKEENTIASLNTFINQYGNSRYIHEAIRIRNSLAFKKAKRLNTIEAFEDFIKTYPDAIELLTAKKIQKQLIYERAKEVNTLEAYNEFIKKYPEGVQFIDIFNLKTAHLGDEFKIANKYPVYNLNWIRVFDNNSKNDIFAESEIDSDGNIIMAATTQNNDNNVNAWCLKLNEKGEMLWNKQVGEFGTDVLTNVAVNSANELFFAGVMNKTHIDSADGKAWLFKLNSNGHKLWNRSLGDLNLNDLKVDSEGNLIAGGYVEPNDTSNTIHYEVIKLNRSGKRLWSRTYTNKGRVNALCLSQDNQILVGGDKWAFLLDKEGYIQWEHYTEPTDSITAVEITGNGYILAGTRNSKKFYISMLDENGKEKWLRAYDSEFPSVISQVKYHPNNTIYAAGYSGLDGIVFNLSADGDMIKTNLIGTAGVEMLKSINILSTGNYIIGCSSLDNQLNDNDLVLLKYNLEK
jgi:outer membrane protein assembly factor BamD (BamD/ComL family)